MSNGPLPSVRCLLSNLPSMHVGDKVRFLGCVTEYSTHSAILTLQHEFPRGNKTIVNADVTLLLQNLNSEQTDIGQWVHVIGYITSIKQLSVKNIMGPNPAIVGAQILVLWTAEDLDIPSYEKALNPEPD
ncbi:CST complex subunit Ten1 [Hypoxylon trugodes]|uniref:CST complex subunit Ten1 n=1 Tax=Hypoxylon trugodes TaxID=326681 RepID=UPI002195FC73|nr:CST complex subunit Ten1 [Hypoxylon trugodes]KAI1389628.1 CST complex subunit Ten1 [Hypoxylon trugodes]